MSPHREALALAAHHLTSSRRSVVRVIDLHTARAIARGRVPYLARNIEAALLDSIGIRLAEADDAEITWAAHARATTGTVERHSWCPGEPLPDHTAHVTCTATAPLQTT